MISVQQKALLHNFILNINILEGHSSLDILSPCSDIKIIFFFSNTKRNYLKKHNLDKIK